MFQCSRIFAINEKPPKKPWDQVKGGLKGGSKGFLIVIILLKRGKVKIYIFLTIWVNNEYLNTSFFGQ